MKIRTINKLGLSILALSIVGCAGTADTTGDDYADRLSAREKAVNAREGGIK